MTENKPLMVLVDGSSYLYRAFHAMPDLRVDRNDPSSAPTGAVRGMINMMQALSKEWPDVVLGACIFDASGPTFRDEMYADYKANRSPMPPDLRVQIEPVHRVVELLGWPVLAVPGVEADDVIGTLATAAEADGYRVVISSGDKDLSQLVTDHVMVMDTMNGKRRDRQGVIEEFGVPPELMIDFQTLVGDAVDNVPGVDKVGPKTAAKWLIEFGSLDQLIASADQIKGKAGENLRDAIPKLSLSKALVTIKTDCELGSDIPSWPQLDGLRMRSPLEAELLAFYEQFGFKSLTNKKPHAATGANSGPSPKVQTDDLFGSAAPTSAVQGAVKYECVTTWSQLDQWLAKIHASGLTAIDTETTSLNAMQAHLVGISLSVQPGEAAYIPLAHVYPGAPDQLPLNEVLERLRGWLENPSAPKLGQNTKYDQHVFANHGILVRGYAHDTMLQSYVLECHRPHGLESLAMRHLGRTGLSYEDLCGKGVNQISIAQVDIERTTQYACEDADYCFDVHGVLWPRIQSDAGLLRIYQLEMHASEVLCQIERNGVLIDAQALSQQSHALGGRIVDLEAQAHDIAGQVFNLASPKQIGEIFFDKLGLPVIKKTAKGAPSTDEEVLERLAEDYPLPAKILEHRSLSKLKSTYTDKLAALADPKDGHVHTSYSQAVAVTGRLSSNDPNLQNIPIRTAEGRRIREAFIAPEGRLIASADYSQIELRIMAHLSGDEALIHAFQQGLDVHRATAAEVFGVAVHDVTSEQRRYAKTINFGLIYGMSAFGLAKSLGIDNTAAKNYIERYFARYPGVRAYMEQTKSLAKAQGYVQTVFGRRLYLSEINSPNGPRRAGAERAAINAPMQGTAADLIKMAMIAVQQELNQLDNGVQMIMQVHDELVFELPASQTEWLKNRIPELMAGVAQLTVPLLAEVGVGANWEQAH